LTCGYVELTMDTMSYNAATEPALNIALSLNERHALKAAAARLQTEFANVFDTKTVEQFVSSSYEELAAHATVRDFLPLLHLAGGGAVVWSGGSEPTGKINPAAVAVMAERRVDISGEYPKPWTGEIIAAADVIVSMGCGDAVPALPGRRYEDWDLDDPAGKDVAEVRLIRDEIERRVRELLDDLRIPYRS
jgi:arsenate reductase (thioredoxin)